MRDGCNFWKQNQHSKGGDKYSVKSYMDSSEEWKQTDKPKAGRKTARKVRGFSKKQPVSYMLKIFRNASMLLMTEWHNDTMLLSTEWQFAYVKGEIL